MEIFTIQNLTFAYPKEAPALSNISLSVSEGEMLLLTGNSGSGKTSLLRQLKPQLIPNGRQSGQIYYMGKRLEDVEAVQTAQGIGYVFQNPEHQIVTDKVWHELAFGLENERLSQADMELKIGEVANYFGIQGWFHRQVDTLSGGQKQILNLAAILTMNPKVILLDEPTSQLDPIASRNFLEMVCRIKEELGITIIMSEHHVDEAYRMADHVAVLQEGKLLYWGKPRETAHFLYQNGLSHLMPIIPRIYESLEKRQDLQTLSPLPPIAVQEGRRFLSELITKSRHKLSVQEIEGTDKLSAQKTENPNKLSIQKAENTDKLSTQKMEIPDKLSVPKIENMGNPTIQKMESTDKPSVQQMAGSDKPTARNRILSHKPVIKLRELYYRYERSSADIMRHLNCAVYGGECFGILGGNGTGKTTLLKLIGGFLKPYSGRVKVAGKTAYLTQNPQSMFSQDSVAEELSGVSDELLLLFKMEHLLKRHPYDLSGGEQQRLSLMILLSNHPDILLLDEPTKGMDTESKQIFGEILQNLQKQGKTIILVSHDIEFAARYTNRCGLLFDGRLTGIKDTRPFFMQNRYYTTIARRLTCGLIENVILEEDVTEHV